jgi:hypothetical protein
MWYWDYTPSGWHHSKKPLTKSQIRKLQAAYQSADKITAEVREREQIEQEQTKEETENLLNLV